MFWTVSISLKLCLVSYSFAKAYLVFLTLSGLLALETAHVFENGAGHE